jgi:hypothetical protein
VDIANVLFAEKYVPGRNVYHYIIGAAQTDGPLQLVYRIAKLFAGHAQVFRARIAYICGIIVNRLDLNIWRSRLAVNRRCERPALIPSRLLA